AQQVVDGYLQVRVDGAVAACPYHINPGVRAKNRALLGKGNPQQIEALAAKWFGIYDMHTNGDAATLRAFLLACGIGVDCSGFASWVLNGVTTEHLGRPIWKCLRFPGVRRNIVSKVRPIENISANLLTGHLNSQPITHLTEVKPGDLIRAASWHHVVIIIEVGLDKDENAAYFQYAQSSCMYGTKGGVRTGFAMIKKPQGTLLDQEWFDNYDRSVIEELIAEGGDDSRVVRLKALA
ncbi:MAG TPA: hypothetical protein VGO07_06170, partial [Candidatus Saccharimonadales bacterium]|nr:hypothetical protein [Candidatus Saccharimonadales bacterium]